MLVITTVIP